MKASQAIVLEKMKEDLIDQITQLQEKIEAVNKLLAGQPVVEASPPADGNGGTKTQAPSEVKPAKQRRTRSASPNSIYSRIQTVVMNHPDQEYTTRDLAAALKKQWKADYGKKKNLIPVISAILTCKENRNAKWFSRVKKGGKWYFKANEKAPLKKTA